MTGLMMKKWVFGGVILAVLATSGIAQVKLDRTCRREIGQLCTLTRDRTAIRDCLKEKYASLSAHCQSKLADIRKRGRQSPTTATGGTEYHYGADPKQALDFWPAPAGAVRTALVIFIHGGGWAVGDKTTGTGLKAGHFNGKGHAFASLNYRLVPTATPADQARDTASAIAWLRGQSGKLGFDPNRIIVVGHSSGAHVAALVSADTDYLAAAGVPLNAIRGTILLDGAGYDVPKQMANAQNWAEQIYAQAFGPDVAKQKALSPYYHATAPNTANWLILPVAARADSVEQSRQLGTALQKAGASVTVTPVRDSSHMKLNTDLGKVGDFATDAVDAFVRGTL